MRSMTGFGQAQGETARRRISVALQTVNHRHLDLVLRLPEELRGRDAELRERLGRRLHRGRCELSVAIQPVTSDRPAVRVDLEAVRALHEAVRPLVEEGRLEPRLTLGDLLRAGALVQVAAVEPIGEEELALAERLMGEALDQAVIARAFEGDRIREFLARGLADLSGHVAELEGRRAEVARRSFDQLRQRIAELAAGVGVTEERIAQEAAVLADRADIREELDRLRAHLEQFAAVCADEGAIGRRLDFLTQELMRELNTVGSKSRDVELTRRVVEAKAVCEQLREQVQNVE